MKFSDFLKESVQPVNELASNGFLDHITYIDIDDDEQDVVIVKIELDDKDIDKDEALEYASELPLDTKDAKYSKGVITVKLTDKDGDIAKKLRSFAIKNDIEFA